MFIYISLYIQWKPAIKTIIIIIIFIIIISIIIIIIIIRYPLIENEWNRIWWKCFKNPETLYLLFFAIVHRSIYITFDILNKYAIHII